MSGRGFRCGRLWRESGAVVIAFVLCSLVLAPAVAGSNDEESKVVATVGGVSITAGAVQREMARAGGHDPERFDELSEKRAALDAVIRAELLAHAAIEAGYDRRPEIRDEIKRLLGQRFLGEQRRSTAPIRATDTEIQAYYDAHAREFVKPEQVRGSIVFLRAPAEATDEARRALIEEAESLAHEISTGRRSFAVVARERSDDRATAQRGGDVGWVMPGQRVQRLEPVVLDALMVPGAEESAPRVIDTWRGVYLIRTTARRGGGIAPLAEVRRQIEIDLIAVKRRERADAQLAELSGRFPIEVDEEQLRSLEPAVFTTTSGGPPSFPVGKPASVQRLSNDDNPGGVAP